MLGAAERRERVRREKRTRGAEKKSREEMLRMRDKELIGDHFITEMSLS